MVIYVLRYAEIGLKGKNRAFFEKILIKNIKKLSKDIKVKKTQGRIIVHSPKKISFKTIFGLASFSSVVQCKPDNVSIYEAVLSLKPKLDKFRVSCQRIDKRIPLKSINVEKDVGALLFAEGGKVSLKNFKTNVCVELIDGSAFVFIEKIECFSGLPVGSQSKVAVLLQSAKDILAGLLALKRGCSILPICYGYSDIKLLETFGADKKISLKKLDELDQVLKENKCILLYSGQQLKDLSEFNTDIEIMRPLIFYSDKEIEKEVLQYKAAI